MMCTSLWIFVREPEPAEKGVSEVSQYCKTLRTSVQALKIATVAHRGEPVFFVVASSLPIGARMRMTYGGLGYSR